MTLFARLSRSDYQDVLRAVGRLIDDHQGREIRLVEQANGLVLQLRCDDRRDTYLLSEEDLLALLREAYALRRPASPAAPAPPGAVPVGQRLVLGRGQALPALERATYQNRLRAVGRLLDEERLCTVRLVEQREGLRVQARHADRPRQGGLTALLRPEDLARLLREGTHRRGT